MRAKRTLSVLLALCLLLSLLPVTVLAADTLTGDGTSENPYQIGTADQLKKFRDIVNGLNGETQNTAACAVLTANIDLNNEAWTPIGSWETGHEYIGTFDGQGHTISKLNVSIKTDDPVYAGLFGYVGFIQPGTVQNVHVSGSVSAESTTSGASVGGVIGNLYAGTVQNCTYTGAVSAKGKSTNTVQAGGIVGKNMDTVYACMHLGGDVSATADGTNAAAGGVAGTSNNGSIRYSAHIGGTVTATVTGIGDAYAGGVVGKNMDTVYACMHLGGDVSATADGTNAAAGGVVGVCQNSANMHHCFSTGGAVTASSPVGTAAKGGVAGVNRATLTNCYYDSEKATDLTAVGTDSGTTTKVSGLMTAQFKDQANFPGWDFDTVWYMGADCPELWAFAKHVSTWAALAAALNEGGGIVLDADVEASSSDLALTVPTGVTATLDLNGHIVDRGLTDTITFGNGSVFEVNGALTILDSDPNAAHDTPVTYTAPLSGETVTVSGGVLTGGYPDQYGGGVRIWGGTFNMKGGSIVGNNVKSIGGGVYVFNGTFTMTGGTICGNTAMSRSIVGTFGEGGGVYVTSSGSFLMEGGTIKHNKAGIAGGGVFVYSDFDSGIFKVSGDVQITDNARVDTAADTVTVDNVYLPPYGQKITLGGKLDPVARIGVSMKEPGVFTSGLPDKGTKDNFSSDNENNTVRLNEAGEGYLGAVFSATGLDCGTLTGLIPKADYLISGAGLAKSEITADQDGKYTIPSRMTAGALSIVLTKKDDKPVTDSEPQLIPVTRGETPDLAVVQPTTIDGKGYVETTAAHEWSSNGIDGWEDCDGPREFPQNCTVFIRVKASGSTLASEAQKLTVAEYVAPPSGGGSTRYAIIPPEEVEHAEVTVSPQSASRGATVTVTVIPDEGYKVDSVTVTDSKGNEMEVTDNGDGTYSFKMPASQVAVTPVIIEDEPVPLANRPFVDVPEGSWFYDAVYHCYDNGYFQGVDSTYFDPQGTMTRAMFATVLYRIAGEPEASGENPFTDVAADTWYSDAVIWAAEEGIIGGYGNGLFGTNDSVTREQMVTIFWRYNGQPATENANLSGFKDADAISTWAQDAFAWAVEAGVISGKGDGILDPKGTATRAQVAQIVMNYDTMNG